MNTSDENEIQALMERYFDGLYHSNSEVLRTVFHKELSYINATAGNHEFLGLEAYMKRIDARVAPATRGDPREDTIQRVTLKGRQIGLVEARMTMLGRNYQDLLTLIRDEDGWKVIAKVFSHVERGV